MVDNLTIIGSDVSPSVEFNPQTGRLSIYGRSLMEDAVAFYQPLIEWVENYITAPQPDTVLQINLEYFNSASARMLAKIFMILENAYEKDITNAKVIWRYAQNDDIMLEKGKEFKTIVFLPFEFEAY